MRFGKFAPLAALRFGWLALFAALVLTACGGGGGSSGSHSGGGVTPSPLTGTWNLTVTSGGVTSPTTSVDGDAVPTGADVAALTTAQVAQYVALAFPGYSVAISGSTLTITGINTNYVLVINGFSSSNFQDCGACGVGSTVSFRLTVNFSESGTLDNQTVPPGTGTLVLDVRYVRAT